LHKTPHFHRPFFVYLLLTLLFVLLVLLLEFPFALDLFLLLQKQIDLLDDVLNKDIPSLMEELASERDSPETLRRAKMGTISGDSKGSAEVPLPKTGNKYGKAENYESNPFGDAQDDEDHYW
jgi:hypothetical protein